jgi:anti-sigma factor RsiW
VTQTGPIEEADLQACVDGQLTRERAAAVDVYLAVHPEERARLSQYADQRQALRAALAAQAGGPIPGRLGVARLLAEQHQRRRRRLGLVAAALGLFVVGGVGGWAAHDLAAALALSRPTALAAAAARMITSDAITAHRTFSVEVRHPVEVDASQEAHLVQWLSKRLGRPLVVPDLASVGFKLIGGRLLPAEDGPAAQFMYENGHGERLTLYLRSEIGGETAFRYHEDKGVGAFYWSDEGFAYAIAAKANRDLLLRIAEIVYQQTSPGGAKAKLPPAPGKPS